MKNLNFLLVSLLSLVFAAVAFTACEKSPLNPDPVESKNRTIIEFGKNWGIIIGNGSCDPGRGCCFKFGGSKDYLLRTNEFIAKPTIEIGSDGTESLVFRGEIAYDSLSQEVRELLLNKRVMEVTEDVPVYEEMVKEAYANSGLSYQGQRFTMGTGPVKIDGPKPDGQKPILIKITITVKGNTITITIEW